MPENEFEKKVSSELQELKFKPSETVWMKVEERIRKKKRRRVFIIIFLLAGLALLGYWQRDDLFGEKKGNIVNTETPLQEKDVVSKDNIQNTPQEIKTNEKQEIKAEVINKDVEKKEERIDNSTKTIDENVSQADVSPKNSTEKKKIDRIADKKQKETKNDNEILGPVQKDEVISSEPDPKVVTTNDPKPVIDSVKIKLPGNDNVRQEPIQDVKPAVKTDVTKPDTIAKKEDIKKDTTAKKIDSISKIVSADSPVINLPKRSFDKKWNLGIEFNPGISSFNANFFSLNMNKRAADYSASPGSGSGSGNVPPAGPSKRHAGFAFQIGAFAKKQFTQRSSISIGLRYAYYSDNIHIGNRRSNASNVLSQFLDAQGANQAYGAAGDTSHFTNRYHFIELPVNYVLRLNKNDSHPFNLQVGLKIGRMIGSNALVYDTVANGIYYKSDKYFNKTQFGFSASLNWTVLNKQRFQWTLGPVLDIHFKSLLNSPFEDRNYLFFTGLRTSLIFNSKK